MKQRTQDGSCFASRSVVSDASSLSSPQLLQIFQMPAPVSARPFDEDDILGDWRAKYGHLKPGLLAFEVHREGLEATLKATNKHIREDVRGGEEITMVELLTFKSLELGMSLVHQQDERSYWYSPASRGAMRFSNFTEYMDWHRYSFIKQHRRYAVREDDFKEEERGWKCRPLFSRAADLFAAAVGST